MVTCPRSSWRYWFLSLATALAWSEHQAPSNNKPSIFCQCSFSIYVILEKARKEKVLLEESTLELSSPSLSIYPLVISCLILKILCIAYDSPRKRCKARVKLLTEFSNIANRWNPCHNLAKWSFNIVHISNLNRKFACKTWKFTWGESFKNSWRRIHLKLYYVRWTVVNECFLAQTRSPEYLWSC